MPVPTEVLDEDIKELKVEVRDIRNDLNVLKADMHRIDVSLAEFRAEVRVNLGVIKWAGVLLVTTLLTTGISGGVTAVWWASGITAEVRSLNSRFDKLEGAILKALEQPKAAPKAEGKP